MSDERDERFEDLEEGAEQISLLERVDRVIVSLAPGDPIRHDLLALRSSISDQEQTIAEAGRMIDKLEEVIKKVTPPANRIGTFLGATSATTGPTGGGGGDFF